MIRNLYLFFLALLCACTTTTVTAPPQVDDTSLYVEQAIQEKQALKHSIRKELRSAERRMKQQQQLSRVGLRILEGGIELCTHEVLNASRDVCVYEFVLQDKGTRKNASADGEKIYIAPAMISWTKSDDELAYILAHEYAHNLLEHPQKLTTRGTIGSIFGTLADVAAGSQGVNTGGAFGDAAYNMAVLHYSPPMEQEADYVGLYVAALAGYDITKAPLVWRRISLDEPDNIYISTTHPTNPKRFLALQKTVKEIQQKQATYQPLLPQLASE